MTRFILVRDRDEIDHYINVDHIVRVTTRPAKGLFSATSYLTLTANQGQISLSQDKYDTADDVIAKIQVALS